MKFSKERGEHVTCSRGGLGTWTGVSPKAAREPHLSVPAPQHPALGWRAQVNGCQQVRQAPAGLATTWNAVKAPPKVPKPSQRKLCPTFWFCYESRWTQVVLTEFLLEVWCGSLKSKSPKTPGVKSKASTELGKGLNEPKQDKAGEGHRAVGRHGHTSSSRVGKTSDSELTKNSVPQIRRLIWVTQPPRGEICRENNNSVSFNHKAACEEETLLILWFCSNISEQLK